MKYAIENTSGRWWTGECWGVIQAREIYSEDLQIPYELDGDEKSTLYLFNDSIDPCDYVYTEYDEEEPVAAIRIIGN